MHAHTIRSASHVCMGADACQNVLVLIFEQLRSGPRRTMTDAEVPRETTGRERTKERKEKKRKDVLHLDNSK